MNTNSLKLFSRPIAFHRIFVEWTGSVKASLFLSQLIYWSERTSNGNGWIYKSREQWKEETGLTRSEQEHARKQLRKLKFIEEKLCGVPARLNFRVIEETLVSRSESELATFRPTSRSESNQLAGQKVTNQLAGNIPTISKTTIQRIRQTEDEGLVSLPPPVISISPAVLFFSKWSRKHEFHIRHRNVGGENVYARGGKEQGWSRPTLLAWQKAYEGMLKFRTPAQIEQTVRQFTELYENEFCPEARTFTKFVERFDRIEKFLRRQKTIQSRNGEVDERNHAPVKVVQVDTGRVRYR